MLATRSRRLLLKPVVMMQPAQDRMRHNLQVLRNPVSVLVKRHRQ